MSELLKLLYEGKRSEAAELLAAEPRPELDIFEAAAAGDAGRVAELVESDDDLATAWTDDGFTALHYACFFGTAGAAVALLDAGADPDVASRNDMGVRPINSAAAGPEAIATIQALFAHGADPNGKQASGHTALDEARLNDNRELIDLLQRHGASG
jgi:ankyrin repeat protein